MAGEWMFRGRTSQLPPHLDWRTWLILGGRGSGKTRAGAEWVNSIVQGFPPFRPRPSLSIALVGETLADVREVMVDGPSGIMAVSRTERPRFEVTRRRLVWANGATAAMFSSEDPDSLRGPQFDAAWGDELAKWKHAQETWDMLQFGLRLGENPRQVVTTTPKPIALLKGLMGDDSVLVRTMRTAENRDNLAQSFLAHMGKLYGGTRLGRQELDGELIEERRDALWSRPMLEEIYCADVPPMRRIVVAIDPPASATRKSDACGIVAAGLDATGMGWVLADESFAPAKPIQWARRAVGLFHRLEADLIVAEINQGGDMVAAVIAAQDHAVPVRGVRANRGKALRAEPIAALYEQGRVRHAGRFAALEDEMCDFTHAGLSNGRSPDRLDALVWALSELMLKREVIPRIRVVG
ncbi:phage terminase large subunit-like protein [Phyllobacterium myrsinacearum]|uniref:DNA-packaging protein n=1 Tax=Phyllobacterium myrsinacearum TaxID=28101 RepID=UPI0010D34307|nr:terminase family protein [Phyllobacterium myrsinacearum]RZS88548.1 phage terminase large subunit-like protein [Phyllobacterium myrsinacearum]